MAASLRLTILTPDRTLLAVEAATKVRVRLADEALLSIYPGHAPLIAETLPGPVEYDTATESGEVAIAEGILQVADGEITVLTSGTRRDGPGLSMGAEGDQQFDRLATQLLVSLHAHPPSQMVAGDASET